MELDDWMQKNDYDVCIYYRFIVCFPIGLDLERVVNVCAINETGLNRSEYVELGDRYTWIGTKEIG